MSFLCRWFGHRLIEVRVAGQLGGWLCGRCNARCYLPCPPPGKEWVAK